MKNKIKYIIILIALLIVGIVSVNFFHPQKEQQVKGHIELVVTNESYDFMELCASKFMETNPKATITITKIDNVSEFESRLDNNTKNKLSNIGEVDRFTLENIGIDKIKSYEDENELLNTYEKNFSKYRVNQVKHDGKALGIPLTSRPLAFYIREDMISQYKYDRGDMNTWDDVIKVGKDIFEKSNGTVRILNATGQDYRDLVDLLIMQTMTKELTDDQVIEAVYSKLEQLKNNNILNMNDDGEFLARVSSINAMKEIMAIEQECKWSAGSLPSMHAGTNKFYAADGMNLMILNENADNKSLTDKFITYVMTNTQDSIKFVKQGEFFSSYLYTYKSIEIEEPVNNFVGASPLVVLSNVEEKTLPIEEYDKYIKIKQRILS